MCGRLDKVLGVPEGHLLAPQPPCKVRVSMGWAVRCGGNTRVRGLPGRATGILNVVDVGARRTGASGHARRSRARTCSACVGSSCVGTCMTIWMPLAPALPR